MRSELFAESLPYRAWLLIACKSSLFKGNSQIYSSFFCIVHELDILYINRRHHYNKKEKNGVILLYCVRFALSLQKKKRHSAI